MSDTKCDTCGGEGLFDHYSWCEDGHSALREALVAARKHACCFMREDKSCFIAVNHAERATLLNNIRKLIKHELFGRLEVSSTTGCLQCGSPESYVVHDPNQLAAGPPYHKFQG